MPSSIMPIGLTDSHNSIKFQVLTEDGIKVWEVPNQHLMEIAMMFATAHNATSPDATVPLNEVADWTVKRDAKDVALVVRMVGPISLGFKLKANQATQLSDDLKAPDA